MGRVQGQVAIVTGGANGIGRACARRFVEEGARVAIGDIDAAALDSTARALAEAGGEVATVLGDVSEEGHPPDREPFVELRDDRKVNPETDPNA